MKKLVIFDLDGTLLNTIDDLGHAANYALQQCGYPTHNISSYPFMVGNGITRLLERVLPEDDRTQDNVEMLRKHFLEYYGEHMTDTTRPYPGIVELLDSLRSRDIAVAVASNKYQAAVERLISHFFPMVDWAAVEGQKEGIPTKPDPSIVFEILSKAPTPKHDVLYCGDSAVDIETARRACIESVGVTWGFRPLRELTEAHAEHIAENASEILRLAISSNE